MERTVGTVVRGIRAPIIRQGDDLAQIVCDCVLEAATAEKFALQNKDVVAVTEAVLARAQGNYADIKHIAKDVQAKFGDATVGVIFPILSRNRFSTCLKGMAMGLKKIVLMLSYPADEVGNHLIDLDALDAKGINPWTDTLTEAQYRAAFGAVHHPFTGVDYIAFYKELITQYDCQVEVILSNDPKAILQYTDTVIACDIHSRQRTKRILQAAGAKQVCSMDEILSKSVDGSGYNEDYGLLGSNKATDTTIKLFPRDCQAFVDKLAQLLNSKTGKNIEVMVYGDGAFKDPVGQIWELADPVVSPAYTPGLEGTPNELKLKYLADNNFAHLSGTALKEAISSHIRQKNSNLKGSMESQGTTPRRLTDLIGSLCDLTSGSGDKGTPVVLVQGYFDNYTE